MAIFGGNKSSGKHAKPKASAKNPKMTPAQRLEADIELIDSAYERAKSVQPSLTPALDAYLSSRKSGKRARGK